MGRAKPSPKRERPPAKPRPTRAAAVATPGPPPAALKDVGPPPSDPLAAEAWMHHLLIASLADAAKDEKLSPRERRKELRTIAAAAAKAMPRARLYEAERLVLDYKAELRAKATEKRGAKLVQRPTKRLAVAVTGDGEPG